MDEVRVIEPVIAIICISLMALLLLGVKVLERRQRQALRERPQDPDQIP